MAFTCDECRKKAGLEHRLGYPFMVISWGMCETCRKVGECEDLPCRTPVNPDGTVGG